MSTALTDEQRASWNERGFFRIAGFAEPGTCQSMLHRVIEIVREPAVSGKLGVKLVPESNKAGM